MVASAARLTLATVLEVCPSAVAVCMLCVHVLRFVNIATWLSFCNTHELAFAIPTVYQYQCYCINLYHSVGAACSELTKTECAHSFKRLALPCASHSGEIILVDWAHMAAPVLLAHENVPVITMGSFFTPA